MDQEKIWEEHFKKEDMNELLDNARSPDEFQIKLKEIIDSYQEEYKDIIEIGCGNGITSLILNDNFNKSLFDINKHAIEHAKLLFKKCQKNAEFMIGDLFEINLERNFDIVFSAGVIEHYNFKKRVKALKEMKKILKNNGILIIAYPNHYSKPYRFAYFLLNIIKKWPYPKEFKIYDLSNELKENDLTLIERKVVAKNSSFFFISNSFLKKIFLYLDHFLNFEGYLTVLIIKIS